MAFNRSAALYNNNKHQFDYAQVLFALHHLTEAPIRLETPSYMCTITCKCKICRLKDHQVYVYNAIEIKNESYSSSPFRLQDWSFVLLAC